MLAIVVVWPLTVVSAAVLRHRLAHTSALSRARLEPQAAEGGAQTNQGPSAAPGAVRQGPGKLGAPMVASEYAAAALAASSASATATAAGTAATV